MIEDHKKSLKNDMQQITKNIKGIFNFLALENRSNKQILELINTCLDNMDEIMAAMAQELQTLHGHPDDALETFLNTEEDICHKLEQHYLLFEELFVATNGLIENQYVNTKLTKEVIPAMKQKALQMKPRLDAI